MSWIKRIFGLDRRDQGRELDSRSYFTFVEETYKKYEEKAEQDILNAFNAEFDKKLDEAISLVRARPYVLRSENVYPRLQNLVDTTSQFIANHPGVIIPGAAEKVQELVNLLGPIQSRRPDPSVSKVRQELKIVQEISTRHGRSNTGYPPALGKGE